MSWSWSWALLPEGRFLGLPGPVRRSPGARGRVVTTGFPAGPSGKGLAQEPWATRSQGRYWYHSTPLSSGRLLWRLGRHWAFTRWKQWALHVWFLHFSTAPCAGIQPQALSQSNLRWRQLGHLQSGRARDVLRTSRSPGTRVGGGWQGQVEPVCLAREAYCFVTRWGKGCGRRKGGASSESGVQGAGATVIGRVGICRTEAQPGSRATARTFFKSIF